MAAEGNWASAARIRDASSPAVPARTHTIGASGPRRPPQPMGRRYPPRAPVRPGPVQPRPTVMLSGAYLDLVRDEITPVRSDMTRAPHRVHQGAAGQLDRRAVVGVVVSQVQAAGGRAGGG